jgi:ferredoxin
VALTLITIVLWLAVFGWKAQRRERRDEPPRGGTRRAEAARRGSGARWDSGSRWDSGRDRDEDDYGYDDVVPPRPQPPTRRVPPPSGRDVAKADTRASAEVEINPGKCARFAFCEHEAPDIFQLKGDRIDYKTTVPPDRIEAVAMAVKVCPARAIKMKTPGTKPYLPQPDVDDAGRRPVRR